MSVLIRGGRIVTAADDYVADLYIEDETITLLGGSLDVQVLSDPHEQQNPLPDREFLLNLARATGGKEFTSADGLADALRELSIGEGEQTVRRTPLWSREWVLGGLIALLAVEWFLRRWLGLV